MGQQAGDRHCNAVGTRAGGQVTDIAQTQQGGQRGHCGPGALMTQTHLCCSVLSGPADRRVAGGLLPQDVLPPVRASLVQEGRKPQGGKVGCPHHVPFPAVSEAPVLGTSPPPLGRKALGQLLSFCELWSVICGGGQCPLRACPEPGLRSALRGCGLPGCQVAARSQGLA